MPAVRAAAMMEYCGIALKSVVVSDIRRDLELKLRDLESVADQLAGDREVYSGRCRCVVFETSGRNAPWNGLEF